MIQNLRRNYGQTMVKLVRRFTECHVIVERQTAHLYFNHRCKDERLITPSLKVKPLFDTVKAKELARRQTWQNLNLRISNNHEVIRKELTTMVHFGSLILRNASEEVLVQVTQGAREAAVREKEKLLSHHQKKLDKLRGKTGDRTQLGKHGSQVDRSRWVMNLSDKVMSDEEIDVLRKGLQFAVVPKTIPKLDIISEVENSIRNINDSHKELIRAEVCKTIKQFSNPKPNITRGELTAINNLKKDRSITILKADKGNCTVVLNTQDYDNKMSELLSDTETYTEIKNNPVKKTERLMNSKLLKLKRDGKLEDNVYYNLRSTDGLIPRIYGLVKIHKDNLPVRPIVSMVNSPTYNLSKHIANIISPLVGRTERTVKNSNEFIKYLPSCSWQTNEVMVSFDVVSLFTKVPIELAIEVIREHLNNDADLPNRTHLSINDIIDLLRFCLESTDFTFHGKYYHQCYGCAMGSPVSSIAANIVMENIEKRIFQNNSGIRHWKRFVDDVWAVIQQDKIDETLDILNSIEPSIKFTVEKELSDSIPFLDVKVKRLDNGTFGSSVYYKKTHTNRYLDFNSNHAFSHKASVVRSLYERAVAFSSNDVDKNNEINNINQVLFKNNYPKKFISKISNRINTTIDNNDINNGSQRVVLPYVKGCSERIARVLRQYNIATTYKPCNKLGGIFGLPKDFVDPKNQCGVVYEVECGDCEKTYVGQTKNSLHTRLKQHQAACRSVQPERSALAEHAIDQGHQIDWRNAKVLARQTDWRRRVFSEAYFTQQRGSAAMNRCDVWLPSVYKTLF